jgi:hypothetical protein
MFEILYCRRIGTPRFAVSYGTVAPVLLVGTALATGGVDGVVKIWSRSGMHRSTLAQNGMSTKGER